MKYIDADKLIAEIEFAKSVYRSPNRVIHGMADAFRQDGRAAMCDDILKKIDSLQQEQPEGLEEAAEECCLGITDDEVYKNCKIAFKAGAEWMAAQGVTAKGLQFGGNLGIPDIIPEEFYTDKVEEVIVQIRKK